MALPPQNLDHCDKHGFDQYDFPFSIQIRIKKPSQSLNFEEKGNKKGGRLTETNIFFFKKGVETLIAPDSFFVSS